MAPNSAKPPPTLHVDGHELPIVLKVSNTSRRLSLRVDALKDQLVVVRPAALPEREALAFVRQKADWVAARLQRMPARMPFIADGAVPILGVPHRIRHVPVARRGVWVEEEVLCVSGFPEHLPRRVTAFLRARAEAEILPRAQALAAKLGKPLGRVTLRDQRTRWGSCTSAGDLAFSWRLIMAPEPVLTYVVAHEVAHLAHLDHSPRFWATVRALAGDTAAERQWLNTHGAALHRYG